MATEFICTLKSDGTQDYTTLSAWWAMLTASHVDFRAATGVARVYSITVGSAIADNATCTGGTNSYTGHCLHHTATRMLFLHHTAAQTFVNGETVSASATNVTITSTVGSGTGDSPILVAELDGEITQTAALSMTFATPPHTDGTNCIIIRSSGAAKRASSTALRYGAAAGRVNLALASPTANAMWTLGDPYIFLEDIDIQSADATHTGTAVLIAGQSTATMSAALRRVVVRCVNGGNLSACLYINSNVDGPLTIDNCVFYGTALENGRIVYCIGDAVDFRYCTIVAQGAAHQIGFLCDAGQVDITNCYAAGATHAAWSYAAYGTVGHLAANDAGGTEDGFDNVAVSTSTFSAVSPAESEDFRLVAGSALLNVAEAIATLTTDICGSSRPDGSEDIGAYELQASNDTHTASGGVSLGAVVVGGAATRAHLASGTVALGALTLSGAAQRVHTASGNLPLGGIDLNGVGHPTYRASGTVALGALTVAGASTRTHNASGGATLGPIAVDGGILAAPTDLYCNNGDVGAQSGDTNPSGITDVTPNFSCKITKLSANITHVAVQVSAEGDSDFSEPLSWDSGWIELTTPIVALGTDGTARIEDITYGQGA
jgi:hypothetical protein